MNPRDSLEYPLPVLAVATKQLVVEAGVKSTFQVRNAGGGTLAGRLVNNVSSIVFEPSTWEGNRVSIGCRFYPNRKDGWKPGDLRKFSVTLISTGGDATLEVVAKLAKKALYTKSGESIVNLHDFYNFATHNPKEATELFITPEFQDLLVATDFPYINAYNLLVSEPNLLQALDSFFMLAELKDYTRITTTPEIEHVTLKKHIIQNYIEVQKSDNGYISASIEKPPKGSWLILPKTSVDFKDKQTAKIKYNIDPMLIKERYARERLVIKTDHEEIFTDIVFKRPEIAKIWLSKEAFSYKDTGTVYVKNQLYEDERDSPINIKIEPFCLDAFVRFSRAEYVSAERIVEIPFEIKLPLLQYAQTTVRKIPNLSAIIEIKVTYKDKILVKRLDLTAGDW